MSKDEIREKLKDIFLDVLEIDDINLTDDLTANDVDEWDSLSHVRLIVTIEREFKIKCSNSEIEHLKNVGDLIQIIEKKLPAA